MELARAVMEAEESRPRRAGGVSSSLTLEESWNKKHMTHIKQIAK